FFTHHHPLLILKLKKVFFSFLTCLFALGGAVIGLFTGAVKGQTTETGMLRGVGVGAMAGAVTGVQLVELILNGEPFSKVALICSLLNGKIFTEWVSPAVLKAYQWQVSATEASNSGEFSDIFEISPLPIITNKGGSVSNLPPFFRIVKSQNRNACCSICLQDLEEGEDARLLPRCQHVFHMECIDVWVSRRETCPICR
ncbi:hypothetical protein M569_05267, partial [Genlisea aurea]